MLSCSSRKGSLSGFDYSGMGAFLYAFLHSRGSIQSTYENRFGVTSAPVEQKLEPDWVIGIP